MNEGNETPRASVSVDSAGETHCGTPGKEAPNASFPHCGKTIGGHLLEEGYRLGGMCAVYIARHRETASRIVVKLLRQEHLNLPDPAEFIGRFLGEAEKTRQLMHPNILPILDYGIDKPSGIPYIACPFVPKNLAEVKLTTKQAAFVFWQIAEALEHAHRKGIINRDVKPDNILVDADNKAYLFDWNIGKDLVRQSGQTIQGQLMGSPVYMAPEQAADASRATAASDVYSLAGTFYRVLSEGEPREDRTTSVRRNEKKESTTDIITLTNRINVNKPYRVWLNDAISMTRRGLSEKLADQRSSEAARDLARLEFVSEEIEDLIMMILNAKDPESRPPLHLVIRRLGQLIESDEIVLREATEAEQAEKARVLEVSAGYVRKLRESSEGLPLLDRIPPRSDSEKVWFETRLELVRAMETLASLTPRGDDRRRALVAEAFERTMEINTAARRRQVPDIAIDERIAWLKSWNNHEAARKRYLEGRKAEQEGMTAIEAANLALSAENYAIVAEHFRKIDFERISDSLKAEADRLTAAIEELVGALTADGEKALSRADMARAARLCEQADALSRVLPPSSAPIRARVESLSSRLGDLKFLKAKEAGDAVGMYEAAKAVGQAPAEGTGSGDSRRIVQASLEGLNEFDINIYRTVEEIASRLEVSLEAELGALKARREYAMGADRVAQFKATLEDCSAKLKAVSEASIGPRYGALVDRIVGLKEKVGVQECMIGIAEGPFYERAPKILALAERFAGLKGEADRNPGMEKSLVNMLRDVVEEYLARIKRDTETR